VIGKTVSHYKITRELGSGGMGVVYEAVDTKLDRTVALKFLPPESTRDPDAKARFVHEAKAASAIDHPNVCNIYEIDETEDGHLFLAMACYEGETLKDRIQRGPLPLDDALDIARQVAEGLTKAHERDIVHRDIKPANLFITNDSVVKILDFGLAKLIGKTLLTKTGTTIGTVNYMSPEQARGGDVDFRTDIWSLGVVLFEMVTGKLPFEGDHEQAVIYSILNHEVKSLKDGRSDFHADLDSVIGHCLKKEPEKRYSSAADLVTAFKSHRGLSPVQNSTEQIQTGGLRRTMSFLAIAVVLAIAGIWYFQLRGGSPAPQEPSIELHHITSIAVLPFVDLSRNRDQEYFTDGLSEELLNILIRIPQLRVTGRSSSFQFKGENRDLRSIGEQLNVTTLLEGSVRKAGDELRINVQLVKAADGYCMWSDTYNRTMTDIFRIQEDIARSVADALEATLLDQNLPPTQTTNTVSYNAYLQGKYFAQRLGQADLRKAKTFLQRAIAADSTYAPAWAWLAMTYSFQAEHGHLPVAEGYSLARQAAERSIGIDENLAVAYAALGYVQKNFDWDWEGAGATYDKALSLEPNNAAVLEHTASIAMTLGKSEEALEQYRRSVHIDPLVARSHYLLGVCALYYYQLIEAEKAFHRTLELHPEYPNAHARLGMVYLLQGRLQEALEEIQTEVVFSRRLIGLAILYHALDRPDDAELALSQLLELDVSHSYAFQIGGIYSYWGEVDQAFVWLDRAYEFRDPGLTFIKGNPFLEKIRNDPRYFELLAKLNLLH
jgi:serine/threonine-protein kinase